MSGTVDMPVCLHIPRLYEEQAAFVFWESVVGAVKYGLECSVNETIEEALLGLDWGGINERERTWQQIDDRLTWGEIAALPAEKRTWMHIESRGLSLDNFEALSLTWDDINELPANLEVYRGPGIDTPGPDVGLTWAEFGAKGKTWVQLEGYGLTWAEFERLSAIGLTWDSVDARYLVWDERDAGMLTWDDFESLPADSGVHKGCTIEIPFNKHQMYFRVRACDAGGGYSEYLTSTRKPVISQSVTDLDVIAGGRYRIQIEGSRVQRFEHAQFAIWYNPQVLQVKGADTLPRSILEASVAQPRAIWNMDGQVHFECALVIPVEWLWNGLISRLEFAGLRTAQTQVRLERVAMDARRVV